MHVPTTTVSPNTATDGSTTTISTTTEPTTTAIDFPMTETRQPLQQRVPKKLQLSQMHSNQQLLQIMPFKTQPAHAVRVQQQQV